ncbi:Uncharacterized protein LW94_9366 [Fusarium fujikuroi]|nr:Uncharacterized protein LW94_9366 [Fusarium fujikuroi]
MADQATITPAEWESLKKDETTAEVVADIMLRVIDTDPEEAGSYSEVREFRELTAEKLGVQWWIGDGELGADRGLSKIWMGLVEFLAGRQDVWEVGGIGAPPLTLTKKKSHIPIKSKVHLLRLSHIVKLAAYILRLSHPKEVKMEDGVTPEPEDLTDWAFAANGTAYEIGLNERRVNNQVIRIRQGASFRMNEAKHSFKNLELHEHHEPWTDEELELEGASPQELVLVVGHCKPDNFKDSDPNHSKWAIAPSVDEFDEQQHKHVRTASTGLVVFWLADTERLGVRLLTLKKRNDSLEFITGRRTDAKTQASLIKRTIMLAAKAAKAHLQLDVPESVSNASALSPNDLSDPPIDAKDSLLSWVQTAIAAYKDTKSFSALEQIHSAVQFAKGSPDTRTYFNETTANHLGVIRQLGQGSMTMNEATRFIDSYTILWPESLSGFSESILLPEKIIQLNDGLAAGALEDIVPTSPRIDDSLYRAFIALFCGASSADNVEAYLKHNIVSAYDMAKMAVGCPCNNVEINVPERADMPVLLITRFMSLLKSQMQSLDDTVSELRGDCQGNIQGESLSIRELTRDLANTVDIDIAKDNVRWILQGMATRHIVLLLGLRNKCAREHDQLSGLLKDYGGGSN